MTANEERFWSYVSISDGCWLWLGGTARGHGHFHLGGRTIKAHRYSYTLLKGEIPTGLTLDHLCRVRHCVRPDHLEPVSLRDNTLRGEGPPARFARATACVAGHAFDVENTAYRPTGGRYCRACKRAATHRRRARVAGLGAVTMEIT